MLLRISVPRLVLSLFCFSILLPSLARAQAGDGELTGEVRDTSQAVVTGAKVTLTEDGTNLLYESQTNEDGIYQWSSLKPGRYTVEAVAYDAGSGQAGVRASALEVPAAGPASLRMSSLAIVSGLCNRGPATPIAQRRCSDVNCFALSK